MAARATRSRTSSTKQPAKTRSSVKEGASPYFNKTKGNTKQAKVLDEHDEDEEEETDDAPKKRRAPAKKPVANKKRKASVSDEDEDEAASSDALDDDSEDEADTKKRSKRAKASPAKKEKKTNASPQKKRKRARAVQEEDDDFDEDADEDDLNDGQQVVGRVVKAPTTGRVPPGQISQNTLNFLLKLQDPACNDRDWFKLNEPVYRLAEKEWKDFVEAFTDVLVEVDEQIPHLPPKDVIHRIYRDVRFSNDKTPYKKGFSASFSRSGRKGIFAHYHIAVKPGGESIIAAGSWCPGRNELATMRSNIQRSSRRLRRVLTAPEFVEFFGEPKPHPKGERRSIFGHDDELKVAPKGVAKDDKDIDLLKCRTFAVVHRFTDNEVLSPDFKETIGAVARVMRPLVHCLNDMMTIASDDAEEGSDEEGADANEDDADEGDEAGDDED